MYPRLIIALLLVSISLNIVSQNSIIESLENEIAKAEQDSSKARFINNLAKVYWDVDIEKSIQLANSAIKLAKKQKNYYEESRAYNVIGVAYFKKGDMTNSYVNYNKSLDISTKHKLNDNLKRSINNIATLYSYGLSISNLNVEKYLNTLVELSKSEKVDYLTLLPFILFDAKTLLEDKTQFDIVEFLDKSIPNDNPKLINLKNIVLAGHYRFNSKYFKSIELAKSVLNNTKDSVFVMTANEILAETNFILRRYKEAKINEENVLQIIYNSSDPYLNTKTKLCEGALGCILIELKEYKKAYKYIRQMVNDKNNPYNYTVALNNMAVIYIKLDSLELAEPYINKALKITDSLNIYPIYLAALNTKYEMQTIQKSLDKSKTVYEIEKTISKVNEWFSVYDGYKLLIEYYKSKGDLNKTLLYTEKLLQVNDTIKNKEMSQLLEELSVKHETEKKDLQINQQNTIILNKNNLIIVLLIFSIIILVLLILIAIIVKKNKAIDAFNRVKSESELQLLNLRSKIIPHFTKNVLSAIGHFAMTDKLKAGHYISVFSKFTSLTLANADKNYVSLEEEMEYIEKYLELEKMRFGDKFDYKIHIDNNVKMNLLIPTMTLHTYCDNAIRHGLVPRKDGGELLIEARETLDGVSIVVCDNGVGRQRAKELGTQGNGQGLKLAEAQLDFYNQTNEHKMQQQIIDLTDKNGRAVGTRVELFIPYGFKFE